MNILKKSGNSNNYIATIAIGDQFLQEWQEYIMPSWLLYCDKHDIGLVVFEKDMIEKSHPKWKKATWQKLLIGERFLESNIAVNNVCFLDADILANPFSPNVFDQHNDDLISLVSLTKIPYNRDTLYRKIAFLRNRYLSKKYPLDSSLFISVENLYKEHNIPVQTDIFCAGFFIFNVKIFANNMSLWFHKYDRNVKSITNGGDQTHLNYEFQNHGKVKWLDYKFQAIWMYEMAEKYPFLYQNLDNQELVNQCVRVSLQNNHFLHFAGRWEGNVWHNKDILSKDFLSELSDFYDYLSVPVTAKPLGKTITP